MGWKERDWYLGAAHGAALRPQRERGADRVGRRAHRGRMGATRDGVVEAELLEPVDTTVAPAVEREAAALTDWLAGTVVTPRFRTPLERRSRARLASTNSPGIS